MEPNPNRMISITEFYDEYRRVNKQKLHFSANMTFYSVEKSDRLLSSFITIHIVSLHMPKCHLESI